MSVLDLSAADYHADRVDDRPSLSKSVMHVLLTQSPAHARAAHPRLNPGFQRQDEEKFDVGTIAHKLLLENTEDGIEIVYANDYRTKLAQVARDEARATGKVPILEGQYNVVKDMVQDVRERIAAFALDPPLLADGKPEQTIVWDEQGVLCRARLDWLHNDYSACDDIKTSSRSGSPESWSRSCYSFGADIQAELYGRGMRAVFGKDIPFRFIVAETFPPFEVSVFNLAPSAQHLASLKVDRALAIWKRCLERNEWPGYPKSLVSIEAPAWAENQLYESEWREAA